MPSNVIQPSAAAILPVFADGHRLMLAAARMQAQGFKAMMRYQIELLSFLKHRFEQDLKFVGDLASSSEFNDTFDVVADFMQNVTTDYAAETGKMATIGSTLASETARHLREQASEVVEDLAARTVA